MLNIVVYIDITFTLQLCK